MSSTFTSSSSSRRQQRTVISVKEGWVHKKGSKPFSSFKPRFIVLWSNQRIEYYADDKLETLKGAIDLRALQPRFVQRSSKVANAHCYGLKILTKKRTWLLCVDGELQREQWIHQIRSVLARSSSSGGSCGHCDDEHPHMMMRPAPQRLPSPPPRHTTLLYAHDSQHTTRGGATTEVDDDLEREHHHDHHRQQQQHKQQQHSSTDTTDTVADEEQPHSKLVIERVRPYPYSYACPPGESNDDIHHADHDAGDHLPPMVDNTVENTSPLPLNEVRMPMMAWNAYEIEHAMEHTTATRDDDCQQQEEEEDNRSELGCSVSLTPKLMPVTPPVLDDDDATFTIDRTRHDEYCDVWYLHAMHEKYVRVCANALNAVCCVKNKWTSWISCFGSRRVGHLEQEETQQWRMKVVSSTTRTVADGDSARVVIGVCDARIAQQQRRAVSSAAFWGHPPLLGYGLAGWSGRKLCTQRKNEKYAAVKLRVGDVISMTLRRDNGALIYAVNGTQYGVAFHVDMAAQRNYVLAVAFCDDSFAIQIL